VNCDALNFTVLDKSPTIMLVFEIWEVHDFQYVIAPICL
jgi:hypothetical protein